jgi:hypothetical protein
MIIANPLYDVVFKYLLEDMDIAKEFLSTILREDILYVEPKPQETVTEVSADGDIRIIRFDFKVTIETPTGELKKTLIELQKLKQSFEVMRFRRYLGDNYAKEDDVISGDGTVIKMPLPIVTIYILGFLLEKLKKAVVKINREYVDVLTNTVIPDVKEDFVELLTHDSYVIQVRLLPPEAQTKLERILQIFNPKFKTNDRHKLNFTGNTDEPIVQKMLNRLQRAIADDELRRHMDVEDEVYRVLEREAKKAADEARAEARAEAEAVAAIAAEAAEAEAKAMKAIIAEKNEEIAAKDQALSEKDTIIEAEKKRVESLLQQLAELQQQAKKE